jgi:5'(3')-deoxyribonucleotidase
MKHKPLLGIDVDLTVCPSDEGWLEWLFANSKRIKGKYLEDGIEYNLSTYFDHPEPFEYWRTLDYRQFEPLAGSVDKLKELSQFFDIVFISVGKGTHGKSKYYWLKQHFPFMAGYMATKEKWLMNDSLVAIIDDRLENLEGFDPEKRILFNTSYRQTIDIPVSSVIQDWDSINTEEFCDKYLNKQKEKVN